MIEQLRNIAVFSALSDDSLLELANYIQYVKHPKGATIIHADKVEPYFYVLQSGIAAPIAMARTSKSPFGLAKVAMCFFLLTVTLTTAPVTKTLSF
ncbi:cyclic nucleotide-binding domain-containing protein [Pedobacter sp. HDW13]|uniref:cyclic nucleotide-binding domain-containing protein n=1 Tax=Pedobacter sp. HDW13 TaxID=2714940 RepID=UPI00140E8A51|nr:cyclic nucleotide-binding domain-containing protein [Pedobacter sp. HDW13]QIL39567.1 cyclic nucleotide-binding domain-containing protein [Pedobacter sp. HDW13]